MKKVIFAMLAAFAAVCVSACAGKEGNAGTKNEDEGKKALVVYFSATGTTAKVAKELASAADADLLAIEPEKPYTEADLDWRNKQSRSSVEMSDVKSRPRIKNAPVDASRYDVVFIGYPIWWNLAPTVVNTFIESNDLKGKKVVPFATSGGDTIDNSAEQLKKTYPDIKWMPGKLLNGETPQSMKGWAESL